MIIGPKGSGKSVLAGLLTQALFNDPTVKILKMDVGSSYTRECAKLGGTHYSLDLNEPSGLNPLEVLARTSHDLEIAGIVADFIEVLIAKSHLGSLTDEERATLDRVVIAYSESRPSMPSLDDFLQFSQRQIPNQMLLERWTSGGMFANIFKPRENSTNSRYRYFDFKSVNNATNPSLVRGSIAAVMAQYNSEVAISGRNGPRIFLFCDETTEFLNLCSPFFITTAKNSRKFGHATILINQESSSFQVRDRKGDLTNSLFENTDHHFLFSTPGDPDDAEKFKARHKLDGAEFQRAKTLSYQKGKFSEVFYKTRIGGQVLRIQLSKEEYWLLTSDKNDYDKIDRLKEVGFSEEEAILCLSQLHSRLY
jgi:type IV secretory pathway VirB4 component